MLDECSHNIGVIGDAAEKRPRALRPVCQTHSHPAYMIDSIHKVRHWNRACERLTGIREKEVLGTNRHRKAFSPGEKPTMADLLVSAFSGHAPLSACATLPGPPWESYSCEKYFPNLGFDGKWLFIRTTLVKNSEGDVIGASELLQDITEKRMDQNELLKTRENLERTIQEKAEKLEDAKTALKVLLQTRKESIREHEERVIFNVRELVIPYLLRLKRKLAGNDLLAWIDIVESNINSLVSPLISASNHDFLKLTPSEIQVINLVKLGKSSKEISTLLNLSPRTIEFHRSNIRKKLGLNNRKVNLRSFLLQEDRKYAHK